MSKSVEDLLAELGKGKHGPALSSTQAVQAWGKHVGLEPGRALGPEASDIYRHYVAWCEDEGHKPMSAHGMLSTLARVYRIYKGRKQVNNRDTRPYLLTMTSALFFRNWVRDNPTPINGRIRSTMKTNLQKALEDLGVNP